MIAGLVGPGTGAGSVTGAVALATAWLADNQPGDQDTSGKGDDFGKASPIALLVLLLLLIAVAFLVWSMTKHLRKVPVSFDPEERARLEEQARAAVESGQPPPAPPNSLRAKALARAARRQREAGGASDAGSGTDVDDSAADVDAAEPDDSSSS